MAAEKNNNHICQYSQETESWWPKHGDKAIYIFKALQKAFRVVVILNSEGRMFQKQGLKHRRNVSYFLPTDILWLMGAVARKPAGPNCVFSHKSHRYLRNIHNMILFL